MMTTEQALRKEVAVLHKRYAGLKRRIKLLITTCDKRKIQMREDAAFRAALKRRNSELYHEITSEIIQYGPTKSCYECREEGVECPEGTVRSGLTCVGNLKNDRH